MDKKNKKQDIYIFNTLSLSKERFKPINEDKVLMYVCGITAYDLSHIGHARAYITFDIIYRFLKSAGYNVIYVRNFTDIDDKIIKKANEEKKTVEAVSSKYIDEYRKDMDALNVLSPSYEPKATETIPEMIEVASKLIDKGNAYEINGYYTKDEICFMNGLFIMDELADCIDLKAEEKNAGKSSRTKSAEHLKSSGTGGSYSEEPVLFRKIEDRRAEENGGKNIYGYVYGEEIRGEIYGLYDKALRYFQRAMAYNPNNPRYHYEYARCLKNSGKSEEAEIFFKKALDLNSI